MEAKAKQMLVRWRSPTSLAPTVGSTNEGVKALRATVASQVGEVRLAGEPGAILAFLELRHDGSACPVVVRWMLATGEISVEREGVVLATARWANRVIDIIEREEPVANSAPLAMTIVKMVLAEAEIAFLSALKDPTLLAAVHAHPLAQIQAGARPHPGDPRLGVELGDSNEHKALGEVREAVAWCPWVTTVRRATYEEDKRGFDIIVLTADAGELFVQVKSSTAGADEYRRKYRNTPLFARTVIVVLSVERGEEGRIARMGRELRRLYRLHGGKMLMNAISPGQVLKETGYIAIPRGTPQQILAAPSSVRDSPKGKQLLTEASGPQSVAVAEKSHKALAQERAALVAEKIQVDELTRTLKLKIVEAKRSAALHRRFMDSTEYQRLERRFEAAKQRSQAIQDELTLLKLQARRTPEQVKEDHANFLGRFFRAAKQLLDPEDFRDVIDVANDTEEDTTP